MYTVNNVAALQNVNVSMGWDFEAGIERTRRNNLVAKDASNSLLI
jgi:hypothetical protein